MNVPGYRYLGPGNKIDNGDPVNELDAVARRHDIDYGSLGPGAYVFSNDADRKFVETTISGGGKRLKMLADMLFGYKRAALPEMKRKLPHWRGTADNIFSKLGKLQELSSNMNLARRRVGLEEKEAPMNAAASLIARAARRFTSGRVGRRKSRVTKVRKRRRSMKVTRLPKRRRVVRRGKRRVVRRGLRKRRYNSKKAYSNFARKVLAVLNPQYTYRNTLALREAGTVNRGTFWDPSTYYISTVPSALRMPVGSVEWYTYIINVSSSGVEVPSTDTYKEYWILNERVNYQISNNSNVPQLLKIYYYVARITYEDSNDSITPLKVIGQNDSTTWFSNNATEDIYTEQKVANSTLTLSGVKATTIPSFSFMKNREIRKMVSKYYIIKKVRTWMMQPSETRSISIKNPKPYLFNYRTTIGDSMDAGTTCNIKGRTKGIILKWQGDILPSIATPASQAMNAGNIGVKVNQYVKWCLKNESNNVYYNNRYTQGFATDPQVYGQENNAAVAAV